MDKQQIISFIQTQLSEGKITKEDLASLVGEGLMPATNYIPTPTQTIPRPQVVQTKEESSKHLISTFYVIGAIIVLVGVIILISQNWDEIGFVGRIAVTLGISLFSYILAFALGQPHQKTLSQVLFAVSSSLAPMGIGVLLNEARVDFTWLLQLYTSLGLLIVFGFAFLSTKKNVLFVVSVGYASWAYWSLISKVLLTDYYNLDLFKWAIILLGLSYIMTASGFKNISASVDEADEKEKKAVSNLLYGLGTLAVLGAGITFGGIFDIIFIAFVFAAFYGSVYLKSRSMLMLAAVFLVADIGKLTFRYFMDSVSWPLLLIIAGFAVIGIGYMTFSLNKKYFSNK